MKCLHMLLQCAFLSASIVTVMTFESMRLLPWLKPQQKVSFGKLGSHWSVGPKLPLVLNERESFFLERNFLGGVSCISPK